LERLYKGVWHANRFTRTDAYARINKKMDDYNANIKRMEKLSNSTDVDGYKPPS
jgi:hypothetical protein